MTLIRRAIQRVRELPQYISLATWIIILAVVAFSGYAVFAANYFWIDREHRRLMADNSTYIELSRLANATAVRHKSLATVLQADGASAALPPLAAALAQSIREVAQATDNPALATRLQEFGQHAAKVEAAAAGGSVNAEGLKSAVGAVGDDLDMLTMIADEGGKAEWANLESGYATNFYILISLLGFGTVLVGMLSLCVIRLMHGIFHNVHRINAAIADGDCAQLPCVICSAGFARAIYAGVTLTNRQCLLIRPRRR